MFKVEMLSRPLGLSEGERRKARRSSLSSGRGVRPSASLLGFITILTP